MIACVILPVVAESTPFLCLATALPILNVMMTILMMMTTVPMSDQ